jgi:hypothetical protein
MWLTTRAALTLTPGFSSEVPPARLALYNPTACELFGTD